MLIHTSKVASNITRGNITRVKTTHCRVKTSLRPKIKTCMVFNKGLNKYLLRKWNKQQARRSVVYEIVQELRANKRITKDELFKKMRCCTTLIEKCATARKNMSPNSTFMEQVVKMDLEIQNARNKTSGDGFKNGRNYEIKCSIHDKSSTFNWRQIRPDHNIDFYILIGYNLEVDELGKAYNFKIPSSDLYQMVADYGGYSHGSKEGQLPAITTGNMKGHLREYSLTINPNTKHKAKRQQLWNKLQTYITPYDKNYY